MIAWPIKIYEDKYSRWYDALITNARKRKTIDGYIERHHVVPNCFLKNNDLVVLTAREHYIAHLLLWKMKMGKKHHNQMTMALNVMVNGSGHKKQDRTYLVNSRLYESHRKEYSVFLSEAMTGSGNHFYGKRHSEESKQKIIAANERTKTIRSEKLSGDRNGMYGKTHSNDTKSKMSAASKAYWTVEARERKSTQTKDNWADPEFKNRALEARHNSEVWKNRDYVTINKKAAATRKARGYRTSDSVKKKISETRRSRLAAGLIVPWNKGKKNISQSADRHPNAKTVEITNPLGEVFIVKGAIHSFCKDQKIGYDSLRALARGQQGGNKLFLAGWKASYK